MASDGQIWKAHYYDRFVRPRASRIPGIKSQRDSAGSLFYSSRISRWLNDEKLVQEGALTDWKRQYKLRHNWSRGSAHITETEVAERPSSPPLLVRLHEDIMFIADDQHGLRAFSMRGKCRPLATYPPTSSAGPTVMAVDSGPNAYGEVRLAVGFLDGSFAVYALGKAKAAFSHCYTHPASTMGSLSAVAFSFPYLLTMNQEPRLSLYIFDRDDETAKSSALKAPRLLSSLKSQTAYAPLSLSLRISNEVISASIAFTKPFYGSRWTVGIQELRLSTDGMMLDSRVASAGSGVQSNLQGLAPYQAAASHMLHVLSVPSTRPASLSYNHPYLLTAHPNNTLTLYVVTSTNEDLIISPGTILWGHSSSISVAHVGDRGKAVSISTKGNELRVWELEGRGPSTLRRRPPPEQSSVRVFSSADGAFSKQIPNLDLVEMGKTEEVAKGWITFDEEKVVLLQEKRHGAQAVVVYDFT